MKGLCLTLRLVLTCWMIWAFFAMALLGSFHTADRWCRKYSVPTNPACRLVEHVLKIEG